MGDAEICSLGGGVGAGRSSCTIGGCKTSSTLKSATGMLGIF